MQRLRDISDATVTWAHGLVHGREGCVTAAGTVVWSADGRARVCREETDVDDYPELPSMADIVDQSQQRSVQGFAAQRRHAMQARALSEALP